MDTLLPILSHPFTWGLALGLLIAGFILKNAFSSKAHSGREIKRLKEDLDQLQKHLNTHLKITATGNDRLEKDLAALKEQNENLRVNIAALQQRPGRAEARQLQILETAVARMREQAPGFAQAWEQAVRQATADQDAAESGLSKLIRKVLPSSSSPSAALGEGLALPPPEEKAGSAGS
ncbi:MAG TPA: hypothetical protein VIS96_04460 [Terrimicrobiaceae bacterium]